MINYRRLGATDEQNLYIRAHAVVFWLCVGLVIEGFFGTFLPHLLLVSAVSQALPSWLERAFYATYMLGGGAAVVGQLRNIARLEAFGQALLAVALFVQFSAVVYLLHHYFVQGLFLLTWALGAQQRSTFVAQFGYPIRADGKGKNRKQTGGHLHGGD